MSPPLFPCAGHTVPNTHTHMRHTHVRHTHCSLFNGGYCNISSPHISALKGWSIQAATALMNYRSHKRQREEEMKVGREKEEEVRDEEDKRKQRHGVMQMSWVINLRDMKPADIKKGPSLNKYHWKDLMETRRNQSKQLSVYAIEIPAWANRYITKEKLLKCTLYCYDRRLYGHRIRPYVCECRGSFLIFLSFFQELWQRLVTR